MNPILQACAAGTISPQVALARLLIAGEVPDPAALANVAAAHPGTPGLAAMARLATTHAARLPELAALARAGLTVDGGDALAGTAALFDRLAAQAPEAAVAFYSLGSPQELAAATAELTAVIRAWSPPSGRDVLDFGCGIGRVALALAAEARSVIGLDISGAMVAGAHMRAPAADHPSLRFAHIDGRSFGPVETGSIDLVIAADSLPYVVAADGLETFLGEAGRVLRPGGDLLVFNWSYRGDDARDHAEAEQRGRAHGFRLIRAGERPFAIWDGVGTHLRRAP